MRRQVTSGGKRGVGAFNHAGDAFISAAGWSEFGLDYSLYLFVCLEYLNILLCFRYFTNVNISGNGYVILFSVLFWIFQILPN